MKNGERLLFLYNDLSAAMTSFEKSLNIDLGKYDEFETDVIKTGKFKNLNTLLNYNGKPLKNILK